MKHSRRTFLHFAAGVLGGALFTPLPWKLADESAKWSQNWSWRPSPGRGEITETPSVCTLCEGGCGIKVRLVNGDRAILVEGNPAGPVNRGGICALGSSGLQFLYSPYRIAQPLGQTGKRGDPSGFRPISWDEARGELLKKLAGLRTGGGAHTVACITSERRSSMDDLWARFLDAYGSPNLFKMPSVSDGLSTAAMLTTGNASPFGFDLENAGYILSFGAGLFDGCCAPVRAHAALRERLKGESPAKIVQVESRCSITASKSSLWLPVAPGTEAALAMGIARLMIDSGSYDADFMRENVLGFEDWIDSSGRKRRGFRSLAESSAYSPEEIEKITGLKAAAIREAAAEFAAAEKGVAVWGIGGPGPSNNAYHEMVFTALNALKGNFKPGGLVSIAPEAPLSELPAYQKDDTARKAAEYRRLDLARPESCPCPANGLYGFLDALVSGPAYPIQLLMVHGANPAYSLPENGLFGKALQNIETIVSFSSYMDETALQSDLILPDHTALEKFEDVIGIPGVPRGFYAVSAPVIRPLLNTRETGEVLMSVAKDLGGGVASSMPWESFEEYLKFRTAGIASARKGAVAEKAGGDPSKIAPGETVETNFSDAADLWKKLKSGLCWYDGPAAPPAYGTQSGKLELACRSIAGEEFQAGGKVLEDEAFLPHFAPLMPSGDESELPLLLVSFSTPFISSGYLANPPFMNKLAPDSMIEGKDLFVDINPLTAKQYGVAQGQGAVIRTVQGEAAVRVNVTAAARPGVVYIPLGMGHETYDEYTGDKGVNANALAEVQLDPVSGAGTAWATRARLRRRPA